MDVRMLVYERRRVVDLIMDDNVKILLRVVRRNVFKCQFLRHVELCI